MGDSALWHGIPLSQVRSAFFTDKLRTVYTLRKLIVNNVENSFSSAEDGAVSIDGSYLNWMFICPLDTFTPSDFSGQTIGEFYDTLISYTSENIVKAWEDFAVFIGPNYQTVNQVFSRVISAEASAPGMSTSVPFTSIPTFPQVSTFAELLTWIKSILPSTMLSQSASVMQVAQSGGQYSFGVLVQMQAQDGSGNTEEAAMSFSFVL